MSSEEVFEKVKGIIIEQLGVADTSVTMEASFIGLYKRKCLKNKKGSFI